MKTLLLIRHAKSDWGNASLPDFERPLNNRGRRNAPVMAKRVIDKGIKINAFVSSPAKRAKETAHIFMNEFGVNQNDLIIIPSLYEASVNIFYDAVKNLEDKHEVVALFAHNPGIAEFVYSLDCSPVYDMPTCAVFAVQIEAKNWALIEDANKKFLFFDFPKNGQ